MTAAESNTSNITASSTSNLPININGDTDPSIKDATNEVEDYINSNSLDEDDLLQVK